MVFKSTQTYGFNNSIENCKWHFGKLNYSLLFKGLCSYATDFFFGGCFTVVSAKIQMKIFNRSLVNIYLNFWWLNWNNKFFVGSELFYFLYFFSFYFLQSILSPLVFFAIIMERKIENSWINNDHFSPEMKRRRWERKVSSALDGWMYNSNGNKRKRHFVNKIVIQSIENVFKFIFCVGGEENQFNWYWIRCFVFQWIKNTLITFGEDNNYFQLVFSFEWLKWIRWDGIKLSRC